MPACASLHSHCALEAEGQEERGWRWVSTLRGRQEPVSPCFSFLCDVAGQVPVGWSLPRRHPEGRARRTGMTQLRGLPSGTDPGPSFCTCAPDTAPPVPSAASSPWAVTSDLSPQGPALCAMPVSH